MEKGEEMDVKKFSLRMQNRKRALAACLVLAFSLCILAASAWAGPKEELAKRGHKFTRAEFLRSIKGPYWDAVKLFVKAGMDVRGLEDEATTPLIVSAGIYQDFVLEFLLKKGADPNELATAPNGGPGPAFKTAIFAKSPGKVKIFLKAGANPNLSWVWGGSMITILSKAVETGNAEIVWMLLSKGADPNAELSTPISADEYISFTALTTARKKGFSAIVRILRDKGGVDPVATHVLRGLLEHLKFEMVRADFKKTTKADLRIVRNTILAQYGYKFKSKDLREHFSMFDWYQPGNNKAALRKLTKTDRANLKFFVALEKEK